MEDVNLTKLFAPEQLPQPLVNESSVLYKYTKDVYDYLRRLLSILARMEASRISNNNNGRLDVFITVTQDHATSDPKIYLSELDFRGMMLVGSISPSGGDIPTVKTTQSAGGPQLSPIWFGSEFNSAAGLDTLILSATITAGQTDIYIEDGTGKLYVVTSGFASEYQVKVLIFYSVVKETADVTV